MLFQVVIPILQLSVPASTKPAAVERDMPMWDEHVAKMVRQLAELLQIVSLTQPLKAKVRNFGGSVPGGGAYIPGRVAIYSNNIYIYMVYIWYSIYPSGWVGNIPAIYTEVCLQLPFY